MNSRRWVCRVAAVAIVALSPFASGADPVTVRVGITNASSDVGFFIADKKGYFASEGIKPEFVEFDSAARMVAPLGSSQLDVGGGSVGAGLYNAVQRGIDIRVVADKGSTPPGYGYQPLLVRKDHVDSGRFRTIKDLKGMKVALTGSGGAGTSTLNELMKKAGLRYQDIESVTLGFPQHVVALQNKAVDAALTTEPMATRAVESGAAVRVMGDDQIYPNHQVAVVLYSGAFMRERPALAHGFMRAYLRAVRDYNDALAAGKLAGPSAEEVIAILTEYTKIKDPAVYRAITPQGCNPHGRVNVASLRKDLAFFREAKDIHGSITVEQLVDMSFVDAAVRELGPYKPAAPIDSARTNRPRSPG